MNGNFFVQDGRQYGLSTHDLYRPFNKVFAALKSFVDADYFGVSAYDEEGECWVPVHVNGRRNPKPSIDRRGRRCRRKFQKRDLILHLAAEPIDLLQNFRFLVNSPKANYHLLAWDIDAKDDGIAHEIACDVYFDCFWSRWEYGGQVFIERSRNRVGRYIWTVIERTSSPAEFNLLVNALSAALRSRFRADDDNKFDAIKGTLHFDDRSDWHKLWAEADGDINDNHRGVLVTMPLAGALARGTYEADSASFLAFVRRTKGKNKRCVNAIPESHLWELLDLYGRSEGQALRATIQKRRAEAAPLPPPAPPSLALQRYSRFAADPCLDRLAAAFRRWW